VSRMYICPDKRRLSYDYEKQVWIKDGKYVGCGHKGEECDCFGRLHAGEPAEITNACM